MKVKSACTGALVVLSLGACSTTEPLTTPANPSAEYFGTLEPFASEAVYFIVTDRFVDGDENNNFPEQGGAELRTFDRPIRLTGFPPANIGYLGGDFRGVLNNAAYIADMGFTSLWLTPIVDNPDEAFTGGAAPGEGGSNDYGKTGYHGYWGVNFFTVDEHLESPDLSFSDFTQQLRHEYGLGFVLDVVCNHGSPAFSMTHDQPKYGELYDADGMLIADHGNLHPGDLDADNPLHAFYRRERDLAELSDMDYENPAVLEYFVAAHSQWIEQGASAVRIDTIKHMPHSYWKTFSDRLRADRPGFFMFAEAWSYDAEFLAEFTYPENGGISVLDFPGKEAMSAVFGRDREPYAVLQDYLHLDSGTYQNPYDLMTFYDNHDMPRIDADENGFVDAHNWLFTSRGIPVVYYGSEVGFRAGADQHKGNRDYFGQENIDLAKNHPIRDALIEIANIRKDSIALQRGLQLNLRFTDDTAAFLRVYAKDGMRETALVLLNKGDEEATFAVGDWLYEGQWRRAGSGDVIAVDAKDSPVSLQVAAHSVAVYVTDSTKIGPDLEAELERLQSKASR